MSYPPPRPKEINPDASADSAVMWFVGIATFAAWSFRETAAARIFILLDQLAERWPFLSGTAGQLAAIAVTAAVVGMIVVRPLARRWVIWELRAKKRRAGRLADEIEGKPKKARPDAGTLQTAELLQQYGEARPQKKFGGWKFVLAGTVFGAVMPFAALWIFQISVPNPSELSAPVFWAAGGGLCALAVDLLTNLIPAK